MNVHMGLIARDQLLSLYIVLFVEPQTRVPRGLVACPNLACCIDISLGMSVVITPDK
jgi:hypothetical protein